MGEGVPRPKSQGIRVLVLPAPGSTEEFEPSYAEQMHDIAYTNMTQIIPSSGTKEEDQRLWRGSFAKGLTDGARHLLVLANGRLRGYLSFTVSCRTGDVYLNELQVHPSCRGDGSTVARLLSRFLDEIREESVVRTYANDRNPAGQSLARALGFVECGRTERGVRYRVESSVLCQKLCRLRHRARPLESDP